MTINVQGNMMSFSRASVLSRLFAAHNCYSVYGKCDTNNKLKQLIEIQTNRDSKPETMYNVFLLQKQRDTIQKYIGLYRYA